MDHSCRINPTLYSVTKELLWENPFQKWTLACVKSSFATNKPQPYPWLILCISVLPPPWVGLDLLSTFVLTRYIFVVFFRGRSGVHCWRRRVEVASAPNFACGVGPLQDAPAGVILWARAGSHVGRALVYHRSLFTSYYRLYRVSASSEVCTVTEPSVE